MSRTSSAASRLAWVSIASISSARAASAVRPATRSSSRRWLLGRGGELGLAAGQRGLAVGQVGLGGDEPAVPLGEPLGLLGEQPLPLVEALLAALGVGGLLLGRRRSASRPRARRLRRAAARTCSAS